MKQGFGLIEVLIASVVLAFLLVGLNIIQKGNRDAVLRIRSRDAAQIIAQDFLDSLSRLGISSITQMEEPVEIDYEWKGAKTTYTIDATISDSTVVTEPSEFEPLEHTVSKNIDLSVKWIFKGSEQSISVSRIIK
jgi:prepilin-type N-terminal cleavage/methylation domain-containing protein